MTNHEIVSIQLSTISEIKSLFNRIDRDTRYTTAGVIDVLEKLEKAIKVEMFDTIVATSINREGKEDDNI